MTDKELVRSLKSCDELEVACGRCAFAKWKNDDRECRDKLLNAAARRIMELAALDADMRGEGKRDDGMSEAETETCCTCEWWDAWTGGCCNGKSPFCADVAENGCDEWEKSKHEASFCG